MGINRDKVLKNAEKLVQKGKIEQAIKEYEKLLKDNPGDANTINRVGDLYGRIGQVDKAIELYEQIAEIFSKDGFFTKAIAILKKINRLAPNRLDIFEQLAELYTQQGLIVEAKSQYQMLAEWYLRHEDLDNSVAIHRKLVELDPSNHVANLKLADLLMQKGEQEQALHQYDRLGKVLLDRDKLEEAERLYRHVLEQKPPSGDVFVPFLRKLVDAGRATAARDFLTAALQGSPDNRELQLIKVQVLLASGEAENAVGLAERLLSSDPDSSELRQLLGNAMVQSGEAVRGRDLLLPVIDERLNRGDLSGAQQLLQGLLRTMLQDPQVLARAVQAYENSGDEETLLTFKGALADAYFRAGQQERARGLYLELVEQQGDNQLFRERLAQLGSAPRDSQATEAHSFSGDSEEGPASVESEALEMVEVTHEDQPEVIEIDADEIEFEAESTEDSSAPFSPVEFSSPTEAESAGFVLGGSASEVPDDFTIVDEEELEFTSPELEFVEPEPVQEAAPMASLAARERLTEASVFAKYGLVDKAIRHLDEILKQDPGMMEAREKLVSLHVEQGAVDQARLIASPLAAHYRAVGNSEALSVLERSVGALEPDLVADAAKSPETAHEPDVVEIEIAQDDQDEMVVLEADELESANDEVGVGDGRVLSEAVAEPPVDVMANETGGRKSEMESLFEDEAIPRSRPAQPTLDQVVLPDLEELERSVFGDDARAKKTGAAATDRGAISDQPGASTDEMVELIDGSDGPRADELEQIDFFIEQELYDDAMRMLSQLEAEYPDDEAVGQRRLLLKSKGILLEDVGSDEVSGASEEALFADEDGFVDLAAELEQELAEEDAMVEEATGHGHEEAQLSEVFREFQKGVAEQLSEEDSDTHFNLGIAYKEMGLLSEAIGEFQISSRNTEFFVSACSMIGVCYLEMGMPQQAVDWYRKALTLETLAQDDHLGILYDLASALEMSGEVEEAHSIFNELVGLNPAYRDVQARIQQLQAGGQQRQVN